MFVIKETKSGIFLLTKQKTLEDGCAEGKNNKWKTFLAKYIKREFFYQGAWLLALNHKVCNWTNFTSIILFNTIYASAAFLPR